MKIGEALASRLFLSMILIFGMTLANAETNSCLQMYSGRPVLADAITEDAISAVQKRLSRMKPQNLANAKMTEFGPIYERTQEIRMPKQPLKFRYKAQQADSDFVFNVLSENFSRLKSRGWPHLDTMMHFQLLTSYLEKLAFSNRDFVEVYAETHDLRQVYEHLTSADPVLESSINYAPKFIMLPYPALFGNFAKLNWLGSRGIHLGTVLSIEALAGLRKRGISIDNNDHETPASALGHDYFHLITLDKNPDFKFWKKLVDKIDSEPDLVARELKHIMLFHLWHELTTPLNLEFAKYYLGAGGVPLEVFDQMKAGTYGKELKKVSQRKFDKIVENFLVELDGF